MNNDLATLAHEVANTRDMLAVNHPVEACPNTIWYPQETTREDVGVDCDTQYVTSWYTEGWRVMELLYIHGGEDIPEIMRIRNLGDKATESDIWDTIMSIDVNEIETRIQLELPS